MKRTLIVTTSTCVLIAVVLPGSTAAQDEVEYSACITPAQRVVKVAEGDAPSAACNARESEVHWTVDPSGPERTVSTNLIPGVSLLTEQLAPGVVLVVNDGVEDLTRRDSGEFRDNRIVAGHDGSVLVLSPWGFRRLGDEVVHAWDMGADPGGDIEVGPDGTVWWTSQHGPGHLLAYDGETWTISKRAPEKGAVRELEVDDTGTLWAGWKSRATRMISVGYLDGTDGWKRVGSWSQEPKVPFRGPRLSATGDGEVWVLIEEPVGGDVWHLVDADAKEWEPLQQPKGDIVRPHATPAGTMWARNADREIVQFDGDDWLVFDESDGVPSIAAWRTRHAAPDGSFWLPVSDPDDGTCEGVANFDRTAWLKGLQGSCISSLDVAPNGTVWLRAHEPGGPSGTFAIRPSEA